MECRRRSWRQKSVDFICRHGFGGGKIERFVVYGKNIFFGIVCTPPFPLGKSRKSQSFSVFIYVPIIFAPRKSSRTLSFNEICGTLRWFLALPSAHLRLGSNPGSCTPTADHPGRCSFLRCLRGCRAGAPVRVRVWLPSPPSERVTLTSSALTSSWGYSGDGDGLPLV